MTVARPFLAHQFALLHLLGVLALCRTDVDAEEDGLDLQEPAARKLVLPQELMMNALCYLTEQIHEVLRSVVYHLEPRLTSGLVNRSLLLMFGFPSLLTISHTWRIPIPIQTRRIRVLTLQLPHLLQPSQQDALQTEEAVQSECLLRLVQLPDLFVIVGVVSYQSRRPIPFYLLPNHRLVLPDPPPYIIPHQRLPRPLKS